MKGFKLTNYATSLVAIAVLGLVLGSAAPASALKPEMTTIMVDLDFIDDTTCDFPFREEFTGRVTITTFFDSDGNPIKVKQHLPFFGTLTNTESGTSIAAAQNLIVFQDLDDGAATLVGIRFIVTVPGLGDVLLDVGRIVFDADSTPIFEAGVHQVFAGEFSEFCDALR